MELEIGRNQRPRRRVAHLSMGERNAPGGWEEMRLAGGVFSACQRQAKGPVNQGNSDIRSAALTADSRESAPSFP